LVNLIDLIDDLINNFAVLLLWQGT
jgi:hypothetical protein